MSKISCSAFLMTLAAKIHEPFDLWMFRFWQIFDISRPEIPNVPGLRSDVRGSFKISGSHGPAEAEVRDALAFS